MKIKLQVFMILLLTTFSCKSQQLDYYEQKSRDMADMVAISYLKDSNTPYIILSLANSSFILIVNRANYYSEAIYFLDENKKLKLVSENKIKKPNDLFEKAFNTNNYHDGFINYESDFFKNGTESAEGGTTYFVVKTSKNKRHGEVFLSLIVKPNPIDHELHSYLAQNLVNAISRASK